MATVITSIGSKSEHTSPVNAQITVNASSGAGTPWSGTVTYAGSDPTINVGDILHYKDVYYNCDGYASCADGPLEVDYLITAIDLSTNILTIKHIRGGTGDSVDPFSNLKEDEATQDTAQPYIVRCFSSIALWEADLDTDVFYEDGDTAKGECYDDTDFSITGSITVNGGGSLSGGSLDTVILSAAAGERHDGTAKEVSGSGVRFLFSGAYIFYIVESRDAWVEWIDFDANEQEIRNAGVIYLQGGSWSSRYENGAVWCLVHNNTGQNSVGGNDHTMGIRALGEGKFICNCIVYNMSNRGQEDCYGIYTNNQDRNIVTNCTVYNIHGFDTTPALSDAIGFSTSTTANSQYRNNISARVYGSANNLCFANWAGGDNNNLSTDDTADGTNCIADVDYTTLFANTESGAEDLGLKDGSSALGAGEDLGTQRTIGGYTVPPVAGLMNVDIDGRDRDAESDDWDIGADQCHTCSEAAGTTNAAFLMFLD